MPVMLRLLFGLLTITLWAATTAVGMMQPTVASEFQPSLLTSDPRQVMENRYDYIIVGAGLSGMVLASRLSEDPTKRVLVIEAGNDTRRDARVRTLRLDAESLYWNVQSRRQIDGSVRTHSLGMGLGGSTTINGAKVDGPEGGQIDAFRQFGNPNWSWDRVLSYMKKSQNYQQPQKTALTHGATSDLQGHGIHGPVDISFSPQSYTGRPQLAFIDALNETMGVSKIIDAGTGQGNGISFCPHFIKHGSQNTRESSATAYYDPIEFERSNLHILTGWRAIRLNWDESTAHASTSFWSSWQQPFGLSSRGVQTATGVTVQRSVNGSTTDLHLSSGSSSEVIVSAGALITPLLLESSGVGDVNVLSKIGVKPRIDLPGVGRNLQEKPTNIVIRSGRNTSRHEVSGAPLPAVAMLSIEKVMTNSSDTLRQITDELQTWAKETVASGGAVNIEGITRQYEVLKRGIFDEKWPVVEWEYFSKNEVAIKTFNLLPWSRGFIHSTTNNSIWAEGAEDVDLHPQFWSKALDMDIQVQGLRRARELLGSSLMKGVADVEVTPGRVVANDEHSGRYSAWKAYVSDTYNGIGHNMGTAAMMSRHLGGVVNEAFQLYGTRNVRVVDASIFPLQISAHPAATLFGIAEMAAEVIQQR